MGNPWRAIGQLGIFSLFSGIWTILLLLIIVLFNQNGVTGTVFLLIFTFLIVHLCALVTFAGAVLEVSRYVSAQLDRDWASRH